MPERAPTIVAALAAATLVVGGVTVPASGAGTAPASFTSAGDDVRDDAVRSARRFLDDFVLPNGRVARSDQGGDTVSEGQGYAMLVAAAIGDEGTFEQVWRWTNEELGRADGLFAWHWRDGTVVDGESASDADLFIAGALSLAGRVFDEPDYTAAAMRTSDGLLEHATTVIGGRRMLTAGPWAVDLGVINPSYLALPLMSRLWWDGARGWAPVAAGTRVALEQLTSRAPHLPPDWAIASESPSGDLTVAAVGDPAVFGWEAVRIPVQTAVDCNADGRRMAARIWPFHLARDVRVASVYAVDGAIVDGRPHAASDVAAAATAWAAGSRDSAFVLLDRAERRYIEYPTYYGAAWIALGRLWLTTPLLGGCGNR